MDAAGRAGERSEAGKFSSVSGNRRPAIHVGNKERCATEYHQDWGIF